MPKSLNDVSVAGRIYLLAALGIVLVIIIAMLGLLHQEKILSSLKSVYEERTQPLVRLSRLEALLQDNTKEIILAFQHAPDNPLSALHDHPATLHVERFEQRRKEISEIWDEFAAKALDLEVKPLAEDFLAKRQTWLEHASAATKSIAANDFSAQVITGFSTAEREHGQATLAALDKLVDFETRQAQQSYEDARASYDADIVLFGILVAAGLAVSVVFSWLLARSIVPPLQRAVDLAEAVSKGDLTEEIPPGGGSEIGRLMTAMAGMRLSLRQMAQANKHNAEALTLAARELSAASRQASQASEAQSEAASGMAASVEEMSVSIDHVRDNAREAHGIAARAGEESRAGGQVIHTSASEMSHIAEAVNGSASTIRELEGYSGEISSIVGVIRDIADQTNLLALNAAIEAARAGEQGRGFAVVADEVRKLAERTSNSTKQISSMIDKVQTGAHKAASEMEMGVSRVTEGVNLAHQAGNSITGIQQSAHQVAGVVDEIVAALNEQAIASQDIAKGVERIAQMSEQNNAVIRETADSAHRVNELAVELESSVARFKL